MYMHLTERGKLTKPLDIFTNGAKMKIKQSFVCIKVKQARVLQPDPRSSEDCYTLLHEGFANEGFAKNVIWPLFYTFLASLNV